MFEVIIVFRSDTISVGKPCLFHNSFRNMLAISVGDTLVRQ